MPKSPGGGRAAQTPIQEIFDFLKHFAIDLKPQATSLASLASLAQVCWRGRWAVVAVRSRRCAFATRRDDACPFGPAWLSLRRRGLKRFRAWLAGADAAERASGKRLWVQVDGQVFLRGEAGREEGPGGGDVRGADGLGEGDAVAGCLVLLPMFGES